VRRDRAAETLAAIPGWNLLQLPYVPAPQELPGFPEARRIIPKGRRRRWIDGRGRIYEWDYQHGTVEVYDRRGHHLGEFEATTGRQLKEADPSRTIEP